MTLLAKDLMACDMLVSLFASASAGFRLASTMPSTVPPEFRDDSKGDHDVEWAMAKVVSLRSHVYVHG
jgi:hypothetical protein